MCGDVGLPGTDGQRRPADVGAALRKGIMTNPDISFGKGASHGVAVFYHSGLYN